MSKRLTIIKVAVVLATLGLTQAFADELLKPDSNRPWDAGSGFSFKEKNKKTRQSLSGIACDKEVAGERTCLVVFDEGLEARHVVIKSNGYEVDNEPIVLLRRKGDKDELDAEGATTDGKFYYVTGSHSGKRNNCKSNPVSRHVIRFAVDPNTGKAARNSDGGLTGYTSSTGLWEIMQSQPKLKNNLDECLNTGRGVNIEGLAVSNGRLYFGFRSPARNKTTKILSVEAQAFFSGEDPKPILTTIEVGGGRGIRDMQAVRDGFLLLAGPDDEDGNSQRRWRIALWNGRTNGEDVVRPNDLARLDLSGVKLRKNCDKKTPKPEAFTVIEDRKGLYRVVILSDGMCDGGPLVFSVPR
jgi:Protein of unknown function (DUF3616)